MSAWVQKVQTNQIARYHSQSNCLKLQKSNIYCYHFLYSFYNWKTQVSTSNSSPNFEVIYNDPNGLLFKNKRDKKILNVDPLVGFLVVVVVIVLFCF